MGHRLSASGVAIFISSLLIFQSAPSAKTNQKNIWPIPVRAWSGALGDHPKGATTWNERGVPLGGFGAVSYENIIITGHQEPEAWLGSCEHIPLPPSQKTCGGPCGRKPALRKSFPLFIWSATGT